MSAQFDRSYVVAGGIFGILGLLVFLLVRDLGGQLPTLPRLTPPTTSSQITLTNERLVEIFAPAALLAVAPAPHLPAAFATAYFQPPPPPPPPNPDVKKTRKVALTYNGYFETSAGEKRVFVGVGGATAMLPFGAAVISDLMISNIQRTQLTLMRSGTQAVAVPFRGSTEVEVPE